MKKSRGCPENKITRRIFGAVEKEVNSLMYRTVQDITSRFVDSLPPVELYWGGQIKDGDNWGNIMRIAEIKKKQTSNCKFCEDCRKQLNT
jgi:hypothetical protein